MRGTAPTLRQGIPALALAVLLAAFLAASMAMPSAQAQPPTYGESFQVRAAIGDIPTTEAEEPDNSWNVEQRFTVESTETAQSVGFEIPHGAALVNASCTCGVEPTVNERSVSFQLDGVPAGTHTMTVLSSQASSRAFGFEVMRPIGPGDGVVILYVPISYDYEAPIAGSSPGLSMDGSARIVEFRSAALPNPFWASLHLATTAGGDDGPVDGPGTGWNDDLVWLFLALGVVVGAVLWSVLVRRGIVQAKSRRQVASAAAHVEAAESVPAPVLEGRKRALLAALKEIEVARMNNEMPADVYDAVKADLKKQAVTVMRALEATTAAGEARQPPA